MTSRSLDIFREHLRKTTIRVSKTKWQITIILSQTVKMLWASNVTWSGQKLIRHWKAKKHVQLNLKEDLLKSLLSPIFQPGTWLQNSRPWPKFSITRTQAFKFSITSWILVRTSEIAKAVFKHINPFPSLQSSKKVTYKSIGRVMWLPKRRLTPCRLSNDTCPAVSVINKVWHSYYPHNLAPTVTARTRLRFHRYFTSG